MPRKIGVRKVWFTGSKGFFERLVWEENGEYWVRWYFETVRVANPNGEVTAGWRTVEPY